MPEKSLKEASFWYIATFALVATVALCGFIWDIATREHPSAIPTVHYIYIDSPMGVENFAELELLREVVRKDQEHREAKEYFSEARFR
jgi:hypothetical protein